MTQMQIPPEMMIPIDYSNELLPAAVRLLHPAVFKEGDAYCCVLGPDPVAGIFGRGENQMQAILNWDDHLLDLLVNPDANIEMAQFVKAQITDKANN